MNNVLEHLEAELAVEESSGRTFAFIYDDATGRLFKKGDTLKGNLSVGNGLNLMLPFAPAELKFMEDYRVDQGIQRLRGFAWYTDQDEVRQTALADLAYNLGVEGLLHWPHFLSFMAEKDYPAAVAEIRGNALWVSQVGTARAVRLETMIESGQWPTDIPV